MNANEQPLTKFEQQIVDLQPELDIATRDRLMFQAGVASADGNNRNPSTWTWRIAAIVFCGLTIALSVKQLNPVGDNAKTSNIRSGATSFVEIEPLNDATTSENAESRRVLRVSDGIEWLNQVDASGPVSRTPQRGNNRPSTVQELQNRYLN